MAYTTVEGGLQWANPRPQGECGLRFWAGAPCRSAGRRMRREKRGCRRQDGALPFCPSRPSPTLQRGHSLPVPREGSPRATRAPAPCSTAHDGTKGPAAPKTGAPAAVTGCNQAERRPRGTFLFFLIQITSTSGYPGADE